MLEYNRHVVISLETEFKIHEMTMLLFFIQELVRLISLSFSLVFDPSMNPSLFLVDREIMMDLL